MFFVADRPSGGDFFETEKGRGARGFAVMLACSALSACSPSVHPSAERIADRLDGQGTTGLDAFLDRRGFKARRFSGRHPYIETHDCVEKANEMAMLWVGGVDVVRVCRETATGVVEVLHFQTHSIGSAVHTYDPVTGIVVCNETSEIIERCPT